ncbi:MAG: EAL domain-containing protein [Dehalococcoidia bacterium]
MDAAPPTLHPPPAPARLPTSGTPSLAPAPADLLARARRLFFIIGLTSVGALAPLLTLGAPADWPFSLAPSAGAVGLCWLWIRGYRRGRFSRVSEAVEGPALFAITAGAGDPRHALGLLYIALFFRSLYGSGQRVLLRGVGYAGVYAAAVLATCLFGAGGDAAGGALFDLPGLLVTATLMYVLAATLNRHERSAARMHRLAHAGAALVGCATRDAVHATALAAAYDLARDLARARVTLFVGAEREMDVSGALGPGADALAGARLLLAALPDASRRDLLAGRSTTTAALDAAGLPFAFGAVLAPLAPHGALCGLLALDAGAPIPEETRDGVTAIAALAALALESARRTEERFRSLVRNASDVITVAADDGTTRYVSPAVEQVMGYQPDDLLGLNVFALLHPDDAAPVRECYADVGGRPGGFRTLELRARHRDGGWRWLEATISNQLHDPAIGGIVLNYRDVTERKVYQDELAHQAFHDPLTGLPNRASLRNRLESATARARRTGDALAVLFVDLDRFKVVNDSLGHAAGDRLLIAVAGRVRDCLGPDDTLARFGGDEFVVVRERATDLEAAEALAAQILDALQAPAPLEGREVFVGASIGIAFTVGGKDRADDLLRYAEMAMYRAKDRGKGRYEVADTVMGARARQRLDLEADLRRALDNGELTLSFQPEIALRTGQVAGAEALVRWEHGEHGAIPPERFIPLAEETRLILPIGRWVLRQACARARQWQTPDGPPVRIAVNVSARQFQHPGLVQDVAAALADSRLDPRCLTLEITETVLMEDAESALAMLSALKGLGVTLAMDDFGIGYSSLSYLQRFPVDMLKIDKVFVDALGSDREDAALARAMVALGRTLNLEVVAEGVERAEQAAELRALGCDFGQGYYFSRPVSGDDLAALVQHDRTADPRRDAAPPRRLA